MSRDAATRRRRPDAEAWLAVCGRVEDGDEDDVTDECDRLGVQNAQLREQVAEVESWYRLLQEEHAALKNNERRSSCRATELQAEVNRLEGENCELRAAVAQLGGAGREDRAYEETASMNRFRNLYGRVKEHRWALAAVVAFATLLARDPAVQGVAAGAAARVRQAAEARDRAHGPDDSGFLRYAGMLNSRVQLERARKEYNDGEGTLKGDALLEAQDRLRAAKARDRQARLAFLPELARRCEQAGVPLPREAAEQLAALKGEIGD